MTVSLAFTSSVNYNATNFGTVLTEFCETWLADRGWSVTPQPTNPEPGGIYGWYCEKNVECVDGTIKRYGKILSADTSFLYESSWQPGDAPSDLTGYDYYDSYTYASTSNASGQWKMYTDDTDDDFFLLTIAGQAVAIWPPSGSLYCLRLSSSTSSSSPIYETEPTLIGSKDNALSNLPANDSLLLGVNSSASGFKQTTAPTLYQYVLIKDVYDNVLFENASGVMGMLATGDRRGSVSQDVNTLYDEVNGTYYIRVGAGDGGSILLNHGSVNPNL